MIFCKIWERYLFKEFIKVFFLFLFCFYGLYIIIDYASHTSALPHHHIQIKGIAFVRYYLYIFSSRAEILIPLALLIAVCKTLISLNLNGELVALLVSGLKLRTLLRPFIIIGIASTMLLFVNEQLLLPIALKKLRHIEGTTKHQRHKQLGKMTAHHMILDNGSIFIFQNYDLSKEQFFDVFWIESLNSLYRIKYLQPTKPYPEGYFVDHLIRNEDDELELKESFEKLQFRDIQFNSQILQSSIVDPDTFSITELWNEKPDSSQFDLSEKQSKVQAAFYWKLLLPWLSLIAIVAPIPYCVRFSREFPTFLIYVCGIFGLIAMYLFLDAAQIVAKRQVFDPFWILGFPFVVVTSIFGYKYYKLVH